MRRAGVACAIVAAVVAAGCGGDGAPGPGGTAPGRDAGALYADAARKLDTLRSGTLDARVSLDIGRSADVMLALREQATFDGARGLRLPEAEVEVQVREQGRRQDVAIVTTGEGVFVRRGQTPFRAQGADALEQLRDGYRSEQRSLGSGRIPLLALTPGDWARSPRIEGSGEVDGASARRLVARLNVPTFLADLEVAHKADTGFGVELTGAARRLLEPGAAVRTAGLVALIDDDGRLRRLTATLVGGDRAPVRLDLDIRIGEPGEPQDIEAPTTVGPPPEESGPEPL